MTLTPEQEYLELKARERLGLKPAISANAVLMAAAYLLTNANADDLEGPVFDSLPRRAAMTAWRLAQSVELTRPTTATPSAPPAARTDRNPYDAPPPLAGLVPWMCSCGHQQFRHLKERDASGTIRPKEMCTKCGNIYDGV